jgi:tetrapyrrole (corrin/porphyrin) methylase-like protein
MNSPNQTTPAPFDIAAVGLGIVGMHQLTREAEEIMRRCTEVFFVDTGYGEDGYLRALCPHVTSLLPLYEVGESRLPTYRKMAAAVVTAAINRPPVCFASYGHPVVFCYPTTLIRRAARLLDLRFHVVAGVSSLDTLLVDVSYDFSTDGLQMYDATDLVLRGRPLQNDVPCVLWQTNTFADSSYRRDSVPADSLIGLQNYLLQFYPPEHEVLMIFSRTHPALKSIIEPYVLADLAAGIAKGVHSGTLFIPPVQRRPVGDYELLKHLTGIRTVGKRQGA